MDNRTVLRQLLSPFRYYAFANRGKIVIDWVAPLLLAGVTSLIFSRVPGGVALLGEHGLVGSINGLLQLLIGFFIAGLAAVFGVSSPSLEQEPVGFTYLGSVREDRAKGVFITRRMLVCSLFGYLAFVSFALYLSGLMAIICRPLIKVIGVPPIAHAAISFIYVFIVWNIFFVTTFGLYYMIDRSHRAEPSIVSGPVGDDDEA